MGRPAPRVQAARLWAPALAVGDGALGFRKALLTSPGNQGTGWCTRSPTCWPPWPGRPQPRVPWPRSRRTTTPRTKSTQPRQQTFAELYGKWVKAVTADNLDVLLASQTSSPSTGSPTHHKPHRVDLRHRPAPAAGHQGPRLEDRRDRDGFQVSSSPRKPAGVRSAPHSWSPSSEPKPAERRGSWSNDPTNPEAINRPRDVMAPHIVSRAGQSSISLPLRPPGRSQERPRARSTTAEKSRSGYYPKSRRLWCVSQREENPRCRLERASRRSP